eukprot:1144793-Pelagomonas_calceolata.AAC.2
MGIRRGTSSIPCLILVTRIERSLLKNASGARNKPGGCMSVKTKLLKRLQSVGGVVDDPDRT